MRNLKKILPFCWFLASFLLLFLVFFFFWERQNLKAITDRREYGDSQDLRLEIKSGFFSKEFCFSSCYPYYLEKRENNWHTYHYSLCPFPDLIQKCLKPRQLKAFVLPLPGLEQGTYRLSVPVCEECHIGQSFKETKRVFSNEFVIK